MKKLLFLMLLLTSCTDEHKQCMGKCQNMGFPEKSNSCLVMCDFNDCEREHCKYLDERDKNLCAIGCYVKAMHLEQK